MPATYVTANRLSDQIQNMNFQRQATRRESPFAIYDTIGSVMKSFHARTKIRAVTAILFALLQKGLNSEEFSNEKLLDDENDFARIRCPKCNWQPRASSRWYCADCLEPEFYLEGCGTAWNTFDTRGKCPKCDHIWRWTSCLSCAQWSLHEDWYTSESTRN